jgi:hypothetical protein
MAHTATSPYQQNPIPQQPRPGRYFLESPASAMYPFQEQGKRAGRQAGRQATGQTGKQGSERAGKEMS